MGTGYIFCVNYFLERIITESPTGPALENLGRFMDNVTLDSIPLSLPLLIQVCLVGQLFNPLYTLAEHSVSSLVLDPSWCVFDPFAGMFSDGHAHGHYEFDPGCT